MAAHVDTGAAPKSVGTSAGASVRPGEEPLARFAQVMAELDAASGYVELRVGTPPGWQPLTAAVVAAPAWLDELTVRIGERRAAAAALAAWLAQVPALLVGLPALAGAPPPVPPLVDLTVRRHADGWFDGLAIAPRNVVDVEDGLEAAAATIHELTAPVVAALSRSLPVGASAIWGAVADGLAGQALYLDRERGADTDRTWSRTQRLLDGLERRLARRLVRPRLLLVPWTGGVAHHVVRGSCCLYYRACDAPDPRGEGYCATCPLRDPDSRLRRLRDHLEAEAARH
ncbi:(2Fe-2S)-binding protein [Egicoccus sp. AB-alg2]|uniref:(2Fe-2S)-binding protein n=1 Tax=Egicoccus sp. AB-alg2 TaxID=3242693 RepID=UPI00359D4CAE